MVDRARAPAIERRDDRNRGIVAMAEVHPRLVPITQRKGSRAHAFDRTRAPGTVQAGAADDARLRAMPRPVEDEALGLDEHLGRRFRR